MRVALFQPDTVPCPPLDRVVAPLRAAGWTLIPCRLSREVEAAGPDLVISADARGGKRTAHPWLCGFTDDPAPLRSDRRRLECLLSHDGFLTETEQQARFIADTLFPTDRTAQILCLDGPEGAADLPARLTALLDQIRAAAGFARQGDGPSVDYIVRVGGRDVGFVRRCLSSLAAQTAPGVGAILVRYAPVPGLEVEMERWRPHLRRLHLVDLPPGSPSGRSTTLWAGLAAVEADLFGMLDDDDALHPNHVASLTPLAWGGAVAVAGSVRAWDDADGPVPPSVHGDKAEHREFHGLPMADRAGFLNDRMQILSCAFLASSGLRAAIGPDPELDVSEDAYLIRRLLRVAPLRASLRVSSDFHWRDGRADNTAFRQDGRREAALRMTDRERLDPVLAALRQGPTSVTGQDYLPAWGQPAQGPALPRLSCPADFRALPTGRPLFVYGSGYGGRVVMGELSKMEHLTVTAVLDSTRTGEALGHPLRLPVSLSEAERAEGVFIIASEYVADMTRTLTDLGARTLFDANPYIRTYVDLKRG